MEYANSRRIYLSRNANGMLHGLAGFGVCLPFQVALTVGAFISDASLGTIACFVVMTTLVAICISYAIANRTIVALKLPMEFSFTDDGIELRDDAASCNVIPAAELRAVSIETRKNRCILLMIHVEKLIVIPLFLWPMQQTKFLQDSYPNVFRVSVSNSTLAVVCILGGGAYLSYVMIIACAAVFLMSGEFKT